MLEKKTFQGLANWCNVWIPSVDSHGLDYSGWLLLYCSPRAELDNLTFYGKKILCTLWSREMLFAVFFMRDICQAPMKQFRWQRNTFIQHVEAKCELRDTCHQLSSSYKAALRIMWWKSMFITLITWLSCDTHRQELITFSSVVITLILPAARWKALTENPEIDGWKLALYSGKMLTISDNIKL